MTKRRLTRDVDAKTDAKFGIQRGQGFGRRAYLPRPASWSPPPRSVQPLAASESVVTAETSESASTVTRIQNAAPRARLQHALAHSEPGFRRGISV